MAVALSAAVGLLAALALGVGCAARRSEAATVTARPTTTASDHAAASDSRCDSTADCPPGASCEGLGCGPRQGLCVRPTDHVCTADAIPFCLCDGREVAASGTCPGARYRNVGSCAPR